MIGNGRCWRTCSAGPLLLTGALVLGNVACSQPDPELVPDDVLRRELGLTEEDRVYTVTISGGKIEVADPVIDSVPAGSYVQFVTADWFVHEILFDADNLGSEARAFLEHTDQMASPPLLQQNSRYVVSFEGAPPGRYPYAVEGNGRPGRGLIVVADSLVR